jgi:hypothetical protein
MDVFTLQIFDHAGFGGLSIGELDDPDRNAFEFRDSRGPESACSGYDFILAFVQFPNQ